MTVSEGLTAKESLKRLQWFFAVLLVFWGFSLYWWLTLGYEETFVWLNQVQWDWLNISDLYFFTHLGDGLILPALIVILFWRKNPALAVTAAVAILLCGLVSVAGKAMFSDWSRPARVFEGYPFVNIVHPHPPKSHAFPSGHATVIAAGGVYFAWILGERHKLFPLLVGLFTVFLCFSRVVIGVHFPADIFVGSMIGSIGGTLILLFLYPKMQIWMGKMRGRRFSLVSALVVGLLSLVVIFQFIQLIRNT
jgi:membrane-associated phospholipid phosphatase